MILLALTVNTVNATAEIVKTVKDLQRLEELKKQLLANEDRLKLEVMNYMQLHSQLWFEGVIIASWKNSTSKSFDLTTFKKNSQTSTPPTYKILL